MTAPLISSSTITTKNTSTTSNAPPTTPTTPNQPPQSHLDSIQIHYSKLLWWLIDRQKCSPSYHTILIEIKKKLSQVASTHDIQFHAELQHSSQFDLSLFDLHYFHYSQLLTKWKSLPTYSEKNLFGQYTHPLIRDMSKILQVYKSSKKDMLNVYLGECAKLLAQHVNFEIPALRKSITSAQQQLHDLDKKETEYKSAILDYHRKFEIRCKQLGIVGVDVAQELLDLVRDLLPKTFDDVVYKMKSNAFGDACSYYSFFVGKVNSDADLSQTGVMTAYLREHGNTTFEYYKTGSGEKYPISNSKSNQKENDESKENQAEESEWKIEVEGGGAETEATITEISTTEETILSHVESRNQVLNELLELEAFYQQRIHETTIPISSSLSNLVVPLSTSTVFARDASNQLVTTERLNEYLLSVQAVIYTLQDKKVQEILMVRSSAQYHRRLTNSLQNILDIANRFRTRLDQLETKRNELTTLLLKEMTPKLDTHLKYVRELVVFIEKELESMYPGRVVKIFGDPCFLHE